LVEHTARIAARETSASGIRWTFSPVLTSPRDVRWEGWPKDLVKTPIFGAALARAYVRGYQASGWMRLIVSRPARSTTLAYGAAEGGRDYNTVELSEHTLRQFYLPPFRAAVDAGACHAHERV